MRIDYVITGLEIGGAEYQVVALLEKLAQRGHQLRLISLTPPSTKVFIDRLAAAGIQLCSLEMHSGKDLPRALLRLRKELLNSKPDIVHSHMVHANLLTRLVRLWIPSLKIVCTAHSTHEGGKLYDWAYRITNSLSQINTTISKAATHRFISEKVFRKNNTYTIYNGIDTDIFAPDTLDKVHTEPFTWLAVGRLVETKDYPTLLLAFSKLSKSELLIVGKGPLLENLQMQVERIGIKNRVKFLGVRTDIEKLYRQVDGFVLSSEWEGYGLVVAEAMASGLPVVATDSGGPGEIIGSEGINGLLVPIKDPDALSQAMATIESMTVFERQKLGMTARQRVKNKFSLNQVVSRWESIYITLKQKNKQF